MAYSCKHCGSDTVVRNGFVQGKQRYLCKHCGRTGRDGDKRVKHDMDTKMQALRWYLDGVGIRSIARNMNVSAPMVVHWIRQFSALIKDCLLYTSPSPRDQRGSRMPSSA